MLDALKVTAGWLGGWVVKHDLPSRGLAQTAGTFLRSHHAPMRPVGFCRGMPSSQQATPNTLRHTSVRPMKAKGIAIRVASPKLVMEEAPESYKASVLVDETTIKTACSLAALPQRTYSANTVPHNAPAYLPLTRRM